MTVAEMKRLYVDEGLTLREIEPLAGLAHSNIRAKLIADGVAMRKPGRPHDASKLANEVLGELKLGVRGVRIKPWGHRLKRTVIETVSGKRVVFDGNLPRIEDAKP